MYEFKTIITEEKENLKDTLIVSFKKLPLKKVIDNITTESIIQNSILTSFRRFIRQIMYWDDKTGISNLNNVTLEIIYEGVKTHLCKLMGDIANIEIQKENEYLFVETIAALCMSRITEKKINKESLSVKLMNISNSKIITIINYNKFISKIIEKENYKNYKCYYKNEEISVDNFSTFFKTLKTDDFDDLIIREIE